MYLPTHIQLPDSRPPSYESVDRGRRFSTANPRRSPSRPTSSRSRPSYRSPSRGRQPSYRSPSRGRSSQQPSYRSPSRGRLSRRPSNPFEDRGRLPSTNPFEPRGPFGQRNSSARPPRHRSTSAHPSSRQFSGHSPPSRRSTPLPTYEEANRGRRYRRSPSRARVVRLQLEIQLITRRTITSRERIQTEQFSIEVTQHSDFKDFQQQIKDILKGLASDRDKCFKWTSWLQYSDGSRTHQINSESWRDVKRSIMSLTTLSPGHSRWPSKIVTQSRDMSDDHYLELESMIRTNYLGFDQEQYQNYLLNQGWRFKAKQVSPEEQARRERIRYDARPNARDRSLERQRREGNALRRRFSRIIGEGRRARDAPEAYAWSPFA